MAGNFQSIIFSQGLRNSLRSDRSSTLKKYYALPEYGDAAML
jgi:hypothetical protein